MAFLGPNAEILPILSSSPNGTVVSSTCGTPIAFAGGEALEPVDDPRPAFLRASRKQKRGRAAHFSRLARAAGGAFLR